MKIWHLSRPDDDRGGYDTYDSCVVVAATEARLTHPSDTPYIWNGKDWRYRYRDMSTMCRYFRRVFRALFGREPIYMDGMIVKFLVQVRGLSWEKALRERGRQNRDALIAWYRGEKQ